MKLAGILTERDGYPLDDSERMVAWITSDVLRICDREGVAPLGTLSCSIANDRFTGERALCWELVT